MKPRYIFVLNRGSSSIKCSLYDVQQIQSFSLPPVWKAHIQWKGTGIPPSLSIQNAQGVTYKETLAHKSIQQSLKYLISLLHGHETIPLDAHAHMYAIGHRIAHGGSWFPKSVLITKDVKKKIRLLSELAPLHNLPELEGIEVLEKLFPGIPQIASFDTAFHHTLPQKARIYPIPYQWSEQGIQRFGFHGMSFQYCTRRTTEILEQTNSSNRCNRNIVICHLGSGASLCAIQDGISIDTTMGFTPLEGLMMDTRSGSLDPGIILYLLQKKKKTIREISDALNKTSGLLGVSGFSSDMRDIIEKSLTGENHATLALEVYLHRLNACIGAMVASLGSIDALVFTAGIGENAPWIRKRTCEALSFLGIKLDHTHNEHNPKEDAILSSPDSRIRVLVVHTQEAYEIARECWKILGETNR